MARLRPCLGLHDQPCNQLARGSRCPEHQRELDKRREAARPTSTQRYGSSHRTAAKRFVEAEIEAGRGVCTWCGQQGHTPDNPLTAGHIVARKYGGKSVRSNFRIECRRCNSGRGARHG